MLIEIACQAGEGKELVVNILCPTGTLVHAYNDRLPDVPNVTVETIHSGMHIRDNDKVVDYAPPSRLRKVDVFLLDEASQIDDDVACKFAQAIKELPQKVIIGIAHDFKQLQAVGGVQNAMRTICASCEPHNTFVLKTVHRTADPGLLAYLAVIRLVQPTRQFLYQYWKRRRWRGDLVSCVRRGLKIAETTGKPFKWFTVTNQGTNEVNRAGVAVWAETHRIEDLPHFVCKGERKLWKDGMGDMVIAPDLVIRLTRNMDKPRGFVNGACGYVQDVFPRENAFTLLLTTGVLLLVHPMTEKIDGVNYTFLPCTYGYATTIRRAQGSTEDSGCLYFDHCYPPDPGYGYVAASRFRTQLHLYLYGKIRRTDWIPVDVDQDDAQLTLESDIDSSDTETSESSSSSGSSSDDAMSGIINFSTRTNESSALNALQDSHDEDASDSSSDGAMSVTFELPALVGGAPSMSALSRFQDPA